MNSSIYFWKGKTLAFKITIAISFIVLLVSIVLSSYYFLGGYKAMIEWTTNPVLQSTPITFDSIYDLLFPVSIELDAYYYKEYVDSKLTSLNPLGSYFHISFFLFGIGLFFCISAALF